MKASPYEVRMLDRTYIKDMLDIQHEYFGSDDFNKELFYPYSLEELEEIFLDRTNLVHGVFVGKYLLAFRVACVRGPEWDEINVVLPASYKGRDFVLINGVLVSKGFTGIGLQQRLIMEAADEADEKILAAATHPDNKASIKALKNIGFKEVSKVELYGSRYERLIMVRNHDIAASK